MADEADIANDLMASEVLSKLNRMRQPTEFKMGPEKCVECEEPIPIERRHLGFKLCIECAEELERRKSQFAE